VEEPLGVARLDHAAYGRRQHGGDQGVAGQAEAFAQEVGDHPVALELDAADHRVEDRGRGGHDRDPAAAQRGVLGPDDLLEGDPQRVQRGLVGGPVGQGRPQAG
jgi:hypothetical protein